jgi:hypothetical protein
MPYEYREGDRVGKRGSTVEFVVGRVGPFGKNYASIEKPTEFYEEDTLKLVKRGRLNSYGGARKTRRRRNNKKKYSRRR